MRRLHRADLVRVQTARGSAASRRRAARSPAACAGRRRRSRCRSGARAADLASRRRRDSARPPRSPTARRDQNARRIAIASSSASTDCFGVRRGPPNASTASQNAPAPIPSSTRPSLSRSSEAADFATTDGRRSGRLRTSGTRRIRSVVAASVGQQRPGVEEAALVGVVLDRDVVEPGLVRGDRSGRRVAWWLLGAGHEEDADLGHCRGA